MRLAKQEDWVDIDAYCKKYNISTPEMDKVVFLSHDDTGNINGLISSGFRMTIEPIISDSPMVARRLWDMAMGSVSISAKEVYVTPKENTVEELEKMGFKVIDKNVYLMVKSL